MISDSNSLIFIGTQQNVNEIVIVDPLNGNLIREFTLQLNGSFEYFEYLNLKLLTLILLRQMYDN